MKLYWAPQTRSFGALWMLEEAGCPYERVLVDIRAGAQSAADFRAINPMMKVPALTEGEAALAETGAIYAYVADRVPEARLAPPVGDPRRGRYLHWLFFAASNIEAAYTEKFAGVSLNSSTAGWGSFDRVIDVLEGIVTPGPWVLGEDFSAVDVAIGSGLNFGVNVVSVVERRPGFEAYLARCMARPAFQRAAAIDAGGV